MAGLQKLSRSALRAEGAEQAGRMEAVRTAAEPSPRWRPTPPRCRASGARPRTAFTIGGYLVHAKETLPHGECETMVAQDPPFGRAVAHALRTVALAVSDGKIAKPELPRNYTTADFLAALEPHHLALARERGLLRADVPRSAVDAFRRELRAGSDSRREQLVKERTRLTRQMEAIRARLAEIEADIGPDRDRAWPFIEGEADGVTRG